MTDKPQFMVSVSGATAPQAIHSTIESARKEAERLAAKPCNKNSTVTLLMVVDVLLPAVTHTWESQGVAG